MSYFCPQCQSMEIEPERLRLVGVDAPARCRLCGWAGLRSELFTALTPDNADLWTAERVGNVMLMTAAKHAAGPMVQLLEMLGLVPPVCGALEEQASAQEVRERVVKAVLEAVVSSAFEAAAEATPPHYARFAPDMAEAAERVFRFAQEPV